MNFTDDNPRPSPRFQTTHWSVVLKAGKVMEGDSRQALEELVAIYWYPLYAFTRRQGHNDHDAMDLTQGFLLHLVSSEALSTVASEKGRFRSFLLAAIKNFMANQRRSEETIRRGGKLSIFSLSTYRFDDRYDHEPAHYSTPELQFQRNWADALLQRAFERLADAYRQADKEVIYKLLEPHLKHSADAMPRDEVGRKLNMTAAAVSMSLYRLRIRFSQILREEVAATVNDPSEVEDELQSLMRIVSQTV
jgi:RNA polymerase sigma factor (sigma-70 family)